MQSSELKHGTLVEWLVPLAFVICAGWVTWHIPAFTLDWAPPENQRPSTDDPNYPWRCLCLGFFLLMM